MQRKFLFRIHIRWTYDLVRSRFLLHMMISRNRTIFMLPACNCIFSWFVHAENYKLIIKNSKQILKRLIRRYFLMRIDLLHVFEGFGALILGACDEWTNIINYCQIIICYNWLCFLILIHYSYIIDMVAIWGCKYLKFFILLSWRSSIFEPILRSNSNVCWTKIEEFLILHTDVYQYFENMNMRNCTMFNQLFKSPISRYMYWKHVMSAIPFVV